MAWNHSCTLHLSNLLKDSVVLSCLNTTTGLCHVLQKGFFMYMNYEYDFYVMSLYVLYVLNVYNNRWDWEQNPVTASAALLQMGTRSQDFKTLYMLNPVALRMHSNCWYLLPRWNLCLALLSWKECKILCLYLLARQFHAQLNCTWEKFYYLRQRA